MYDPLTTLLVVAVVLLIAIVSIFLIMLILVLFSMKKTLVKLNRAIENVEDTALRSMAPFLSFKALFSDTRGFMSAMTTVVKAIGGKKSNR